MIVTVFQFKSDIIDEGLWAVCRDELILYKTGGSSSAGSIRWLRFLKIQWGGHLEGAEVAQLWSKSAMMSNFLDA